MLLTFMYHRIGLGKHSNTLPMLRAHLTYLKENYPLVLPGDTLEKGCLSICLTFDDATFDFYHYVFPLLQELRMRVVLGVPTLYILEETQESPATRLAVPYTLAMQEGIYETRAPFCTWKELAEMVRSGLVEVASHGHMHCNLTFSFVNLEREVVYSKKLLEEYLCQPISSFIYPFGRVNDQVHAFVAAHYPYAFRIGTALNKNWGNGKKPLCRVPADNMASPGALLSRYNLFRYGMGYVFG